jgi:hypothetical protein
MRLHVAILLLSLAVLHVCSLPLGSFGNYKAQEEGGAASTTTKGVGESGGGQDQPGARHSKGGGGVHGRRKRSGKIHGGGEADDSSAKLSAIKLSGTNGIKGFRTFVDEEGRERIFHGVNAVVKGPPWIPTYGAFDVETSLGPDDFEILQDLGVNVIRLGIMWAGIEPTRGTYHEPYLIAAKKIASQAAKYGIYTLLDMHQDVVRHMRHSPLSQFCNATHRRLATHTSASTHVSSHTRTYFASTIPGVSKLLITLWAPPPGSCRTSFVGKACQHGPRSQKECLFQCPALTLTRTRTKMDFRRGRTATSSAGPTTTSRRR